MVAKGTELLTRPVFILLVETAVDDASLFILKPLGPAQLAAIRGRHSRVASPTDAAGCLHSRWDADLRGITNWAALVVSDVAASFGGARKGRNSMRMRIPGRLLHGGVAITWAARLTLSGWSVVCCLSSGGDVVSSFQIACG